MDIFTIRETASSRFACNECSHKPLFPQPTKILSRLVRSSLSDCFYFKLRNRERHTDILGTKDHRFEILRGCDFSTLFADGEGGFYYLSKVLILMDCGKYETKEKISDG